MKKSNWDTTEFIKKFLLINVLLIPLILYPNIGIEVFYFFSAYFSFIVLLTNIFKKRYSIIKIVILAFITYILHNHFLYTYRTLAIELYLPLASLPIALIERDIVPSSINGKMKRVLYILAGTMMLLLITYPLIFQPYEFTSGEITSLKISRYTGLEIITDERRASTYEYTYLWSQEVEVSDPEIIEVISNNISKASKSATEGYRGIMLKRGLEDNDFYRMRVVIDGYEYLEIYYNKGAIVGVKDETDYFRIYTTKKVARKLEGVLNNLSFEGGDPNAKSGKK